MSIAKRKRPETHLEKWNVIAEGVVDEGEPGVAEHAADLDVTALDALPEHGHGIAGHTDVPGTALGHLPRQFGQRLRQDYVQGGRELDIVNLEIFVYRASLRFIIGEGCSVGEGRVLYLLL